MYDKAHTGRISGHTPHYAFIDGLKGIAIIMIVAFHLQFIYSGFPEYLNKLLAFNGVWVEMFFVVSAFTLTATTLVRKNFNFFRYMYKRYIRLAPAYYVMLVIAFLSMPLMITTFQYKDHIVSLLEHMAFVNTAPFDQVNQVEILGIEWYVPVQFWLYVFVPITVFLSAWYGPLYAVLLFLAFYLHFNKNAVFTYQDFFDFASSLQNFIWVYVYAIGVQLLRLGHAVRFSFTTVLTSLGLLLCYTYFIPGIQTASEQLYITVLLLVTFYEIFLAQLFVKKAESVSSFAATVIGHLSVFILFVMFYKYVLNWYFVKNPHEFMAFWSAALVCAAYRRPWLLRKLLENRFLVAMGIYSYEIYLTHYFVITAIGYIIPGQGPYVRTIFIVPVTLFLSYLLHIFVSKPALTLLKRPS